MKNKQAQAMAKLRWGKTTPEERTAHARIMVKAREDKKKKNAIA